MKKNIFALLACIAVLSFAACEDYNKDNFGIDNDANNITEVANYTADYDGEYPGDGEYFDSKGIVESTLSTWLKDKYYACDVNSTAEVKIQYAEVVLGEAVVVNFKDTLQTDDYVAMGTERGMPGKYKNFDKKMDMNFYINTYLNNKYPYKTNKTVAAIAIDFYVGGAGLKNDSTFIFTKMDNAWSLNANTVETRTVTGEDAAAVTTYNWTYADATVISTRIAQMKKLDTSWQLLRLIGGTKAFTFENEHYELLAMDAINKVKAGDLHEKYYDESFDAKAEYYYGSSFKYYNINQKYYTWKKHYNPGNGVYDDLDDDEMQALMDRRLAQGIIDVILPVLVPTPDSGLSYAISYKVYGDKGDGMYTMTFMYSEQLSAWEQTAGPIKQ